MIAPRSSPRASLFPDSGPSKYRPWKERVLGVVGLSYIVSSLVFSVWYLFLLHPSIKNNLYWPEYNTSGYEGFLIDLLNHQLDSEEFGEIDFLSYHYIIRKSYASEEVEPLFTSIYARKSLHLELNQLEQAIQSLRNTTMNDALSIYSQYCWVDIDRRWETAHTQARADRCLERYKSNAAVYLETLLRNINWNWFILVSGEEWDVAIARAVETSPDGIAWLADRPKFALSLSVSDEVAFLKKHNLTRYQLQWHNEYYVGIAETVQLENALGIQQKLLLKSQSTVHGPWSSIILFWNFRNDLFIYSDFNTSLVRHAENAMYDGAISYAYGMHDAQGLYRYQVGVFVSSIGPLGSIDAYVVPVPQSLRQLVSNIQLTFSQAINSDPWFHESIRRNNDVQMTLFPPRFREKKWYFFGGNPLCLENPPTQFPQSQISFQDECMTLNPIQTGSSVFAVLFALYSSGQTNFSQICSHQLGADCITLLHQLQPILNKLNPPPSLPMIDIPAIELIQYALYPPFNEWRLLRQPLMGKDPTWNFFGWIYLYEWIAVEREVLSLEGDINSFMLISEVQTKVPTSTSLEFYGSSNSEISLLFTIGCVTGIMCFVALIVTLQLLLSGFNVDAWNLFMFHRVAGSVWIGRPLMLLRGLTALIFLSSGQVSLVSIDGYASFHATRHTLLARAVIASEANWICYVIQDFALVFRFNKTPRRTAPIVSLVAWLLTFLMDTYQPVSITATLQRVCTPVGTDKAIRCTSGIVQAGSLFRLVSYLLIQCGTQWISALLSRLSKATPGSINSPLAFHGSAQAFFIPSTSHDVWPLDTSSCVISGLVPITFRTIRYILDMKTWVIYRHSSTSSIFKSPSWARINIQPSLRSLLASRSSERSNKLLVAGGVLFTILSLINSVTYIQVSSVNFANDFFWATFNLTGHHLMLSTWFVDQLTFNRTFVDIRMDELRWTRLALNFSEMPLLVPSTLASQLQEEFLDDLADIISGLRRTHGCNVPWIMTSYCYLDFEKRWSMANTPKRAERCIAMQGNGAVYLESALRNIDWGEWKSCWGGAFQVGFENDLIQLNEGRRWLMSMQEDPLPIANEIQAWLATGIQHYKTQWQNFKTTGLAHTYSIETAFGVQYPLTISKSGGRYRLDSQTSLPMYWTFAFDLFSLVQNTSTIHGKSLISNSENYAFRNRSLQEVMMSNGTLVSPLPEAFRLVIENIGPYGSNDMKLIPCPPSVRHYLGKVIDALRASGASSTASLHAYLNVSSASSFDLSFLPLAFLERKEWLIYGGSILCSESRIGGLLQFGITQLFNRWNTCGQMLAARLIPSKQLIMASLIASRVQVYDDKQIAALCQHEKDPKNCKGTYIVESLAYLAKYIDNQNSLVRLAEAAMKDLYSLRIAIMQYARENYTEPLQIIRFELFNASEPSFEFWSWLYTFGWAIGEREVVRFEGDAGSIHLISDYNDHTNQLARRHELATTFAAYTRVSVVYVTMVSLAVASLVMVYAIASRGYIDGWNLLKLNRVGSLVWIGRPLLFIRGFTALVMLSTASLELQQHRFTVQFIVPLSPWYKIFLGASETTWLVFILDDILLVWTKHRTKLQASIDNILAWLVTGALTLSKPVEHRVTYSPACRIDQMDFEMTCTSGVVSIGNVQRLNSLLCIVCGVTFCSICISRCMQSDEEKDEKIQALLGSGAKYLFNRRGWIFHNVYFMDPVSAMLNGIIIIKWKQCIYALDAKSWRTFRLPQNELTEDIPTWCKMAFPLPD